MLKRFLAAAALVLAPAFAFGQATVIQGGSQTQGHIPAYATTGGTPVVTDGGTSAGGVLGANPSTIGITARCSDPPCVAEGAGPNGEDFAIFDGPTSDADGYHYLGFSANIGSKATITTGAGGGAAAQGLQFIIDGTTYAFPEDFPQIPVEVDEGGTGRQTLTQYNLLVGDGTSPVGLIAPSATSGIPLISQGSSANPVYGTAAVAGGGTGATTANDALNNLLPAQAGQNGKVLSTDGTDASWVNIPGTGTVTSVTFTDGLTADINPCVASCTAGLATIADDRLLANVSGGAAVPTATTTSALLDATVGSAQGSLVTRGAANWLALTPGTNGYALLSQGPGSDLVFGQYLINNLAITGQAQGDIAYYNGAAWTRLGIGTSGQVLSGGTDPVWQAVNGTQIRMGSDAQGDILYFNGTNYVRLPPGTSGQFLQTQGAGANPAWGSPVQKFVSTGQSFSNGSALSAIPHGLAGQPQIVEVWLTCNNVSGCSGFNQNDQTQINPGGMVDGASSYGIYVVADATNISIGIGNNGPIVINRSTLTATTITAADWSLFVKALYIP